MWRMPSQDPEVERYKSLVSIVTVTTVQKSVGCVLTTSPHTFTDWYVDNRCKKDSENHL